MTLTQLKDVIDKLYQNPANRKKEIFGDVKPGLKVTKVKMYSNYFIAIYDEREE